MNGWRTLFPNAWYVAAREFRGRVRTRSFIIGTVLLAAIAFATTQLPVLIDFSQSTSQTRMGVVVRASDMPANSAALMDVLLNGQSSDPNAHKTFTLSWFDAASMAAAEKDLDQGNLDALVVVDRDATTGNLAFTIQTDMASDGTTMQNVMNALAWVYRNDIAVRAGTSLGALNQTPITVVPVKAGETKSIADEISTSLLSTGLIVLIFMAIVTYGTWVAMSVAEEKGSRVMELMLNATTPLQMLAGKVIGNGAAGLTQYGSILAAVLVGLLAQGPIHEAVLGSAGTGPEFGGLTPAVLVAFMILFVGGFLLYSLLYAALGSLVSRQEDVQSATSPLMMMIFIGYFASVFALQAIDETWVKVLSFVPFFSPYLMLARVAVGHVALWEFVLAVVFMVAAIAIALVVAARIYSAGVLLYGQRVGLRQVLKASRVSR
jgi:ABC-2 type transport system permease protein